MSLASVRFKDNRRSAENEAGFGVIDRESSTQITNWGDGSANLIAAAYNPNRQSWLKSFIDEQVSQRGDGASREYLPELICRNLDRLP